MKVNLEELRSRKGYISEQKHPTLDLIVWNYTQKTQYDRAWDAYTRMARGLITDSNGWVIARPFPKFFNLAEHDGERLPVLPDKIPEVFDKLDGSLGILYWNEGWPCIATRGSFVSDQAIWATEWIQEKFKDSDTGWLTSYTYLFEIIYPENRIVVDYGDRKDLVLLAVINTETGQELDHVVEGKRLGLHYTVPLHIPIEDLLEMAKTMDGNQEGFVLKYSDDFRVKLKGEEYVRLHRLLTGFSSTSIWEALSKGEDIEILLERVPDEFYDWVKQTKADIEAASADLLHRVESALGQVKKENTTRKSQAEFTLKHYKDISGLIFGLLDGKPIGAKIWRMVKPKFAKPFKQEEETSG